MSGVCEGKGRSEWDERGNEGRRGDVVSGDCKGNGQSEWDERGGRGKK